MKKNQWYYALGSSSDKVKDLEQYKFSAINILSDLNSYLPENEGYIWLKTDFKIDPESDSYAISLGRITMADETYVNGYLIGKTGKFPPDFFSEWNKNRLYKLHKTILKDENTLLLKIYVNAEGGVQGNVSIMPVANAESYHLLKEFLDSYFNIFVAVVMLMIAGYHLLVFFHRPKDKENLYYSLLSFFFVIYLTNFFITRIPFKEYPISYLNFQKIIFISLFVMIGITVLFFRTFLKIKIHPVIRYIVIFSCTLPIIIILIPSNYRSFYNMRFMITAIFSIIPLVYVLYMIIYSAVKKVDASRALLIGSIPLFFCIGFDLLFHVVLKYDDMIYLAGFGFPSFMLSMAAILARRFVQYHNEVEEYKETLEIKVKDRTEELNKRNIELEEAQNIMERDMAMAENVQKSLFPRENIEDEQWDVSFAFKPMSGVSGDMYDFFEIDGKLAGAGLFDVSGHGIASGLITLLSKTIINRYFYSMYDVKLNKVIEKINASLIKELGNVDNYLTGILLRTRDNLVEYVNAGHTELLYRSGKTGKVRVVNLDGQDVKGMFLGIEGMQSKYTALQFEMDKDDILLMYSDCLNETVNDKNEEYSIKRIIDVLEKAEPVSAQKIRNSIIIDFAEFLWPDVKKDDHFIKSFLSGKGDYNLNDDFTLVILKKE